MSQPLCKIIEREDNTQGPGSLSATCVHSKEQKANKQAASEKEIQEAGLPCHTDQARNSIQIILFPGISPFIGLQRLLHHEAFSVISWLMPEVACFVKSFTKNNDSSNYHHLLLSFFKGPEMPLCNPVKIKATQNIQWSELQKNLKVSF